MTQEKLTQKQELRLTPKKAVENDLRLYQRYLGKVVIMEEGPGQEISVGRLTVNGFDNIQLQNYSRWMNTSLERVRKYITEPETYRNKPFDFIEFSSPEITLNKSQISSIQPLENLVVDFPFSELGLRGFENDDEQIQRLAVYRASLGEQ